jgi:hypothetical protein
MKVKTPESGKGGQETGQRVNRADRGKPNSLHDACTQTNTIKITVQRKHAQTYNKFLQAKLAITRNLGHSAVVSLIVVSLQGVLDLSLEFQIYRLLQPQRAAKQDDPTQRTWYTPPVKLQPCRSGIGCLLSVSPLDSQVHRENTVTARWTLV